MKKIWIFMLLVLTSFYGCNDETAEDAIMADIDGLSLYWQHEVFGEEGRRLMFQFDGDTAFERDYELVFNYHILGKIITVNLTKAIDKGKCPYYPMPVTEGSADLCNASGSMYIPDDQLANGTYQLIIKTPAFTSQSELIVDSDKITLNIPSDQHFSSQVEEVYPIPEDVLFGDVVYSGDENNPSVHEFFQDLSDLGLTEITLPDYPYNHLTLNDEGKAEESHWEPDNHSIGFLYKIDDNFEDIFNLAKEYFSNSDINIYLYTGKGDQGLMNQDSGITAIFAD